MPEIPLNQIKQSLAKKIPTKLLDHLPSKWEKIGDILLIKLHSELEQHRRIIGKTYAKILRCRTVLQETGNITGVFREPHVEIIFGPRDTETIHIENKIRYQLDPQKIMFSSGNMNERLRMAHIAKGDETIVDLFAGIGYFTLPLAVYSRPKEIYACEINPVAYGYLCRNIVLNDVTEIVKPLLGDNRYTAPNDVADRVIMGYITDTYTFLPLAVECLKNNSGIIHYHEIWPNKLMPEEPVNLVRKVAAYYDKHAQVLKEKHIKSYAPGVNHVVFDIQVG
jgi:tRNA wybutosine-synthesizing protein 2